MKQKLMIFLACLALLFVAAWVVIGLRAFGFIE